jgi:hypothetical protein
MPGDRLARAAASALALALAAAACGDQPATPTPTPSLPPVVTPAPAEDLPLPDEDASLEQVLLRNADGRFDRYRSIGQLQGAASTCTAVLLDTAAPATAPAYAMTSGHCVGISGANEVLLDRDAGGAQVAFDWFTDVAEHEVVPVTSVAWATMRGTDLAVLELGATVGELQDLGLRGWRPVEAVAPTGSQDILMLGIPVGAPIVDIPETERYLRLGQCTQDNEPVRLNERQWLWTASLRNDCPQVLPGNSGSAVLDPATGGLLGLISTTTYKGEQGAECWLGRPCESGEDGEVSFPDTSYAQPVAGLAACFAGGGFATGGACPLAAGPGPTLEGAPLAVNPSASPPIEGMPPVQAAWDTTVGGEGIAQYRWKTGPLGTEDCAAEDGYSAPVSVAQAITEPLPTTEQRLLLCVVADGDATANASIAVASVDTTPPTAKVRFAVGGDAASGWQIEPVFDPPELSFFLVKGGPATSTDCADTGGYAPYRRIPIDVPADDAPYRFCAIGFDDAANAAPAAGKVLR